MERGDNRSLGKWSLLFFLAVMIQVTVLQFIAVEVRPNISVQPDLILLVLFFFGLRFQQSYSVVAGFVSGLLYDILGGGILGLTAFSKTIVGFAVGFLPRVHKIQKIAQFIMMLFLVTISHDIILNGVYIINTDLNYLRLVLTHSLPSAIYTVFVGVIIFYWQK